MVSKSFEKETWNWKDELAKEGSFEEEEAKTFKRKKEENAKNWKGRLTPSNEIKSAANKAYYN